MVPSLAWDQTHLKTVKNGFMGSINESMNYESVVKHKRNKQNSPDMQSGLRLTDPETKGGIISFQTILSNYTFPQPGFS